MARKIMDLAVCVGQYRDRNGKERGKWQNVGALMKNNDGSQFILLERYFNPAGVPNPDNQQSVLINCFEPRVDYSQQPTQKKSAPEAPPAADIDDEIPF